MKKGKSTGARALVKELEHAGSSVIFGYPGGATLPIYDELRTSSIRHILTRHEQGAAHMADGYSRITGKTGVCMATSGPGATNLVTGIATAYMDSSSILAVTGQVPRSMIGNDAFQEVDITGITVPVTKHNYLVQNANDIPHTLREAFYLSSTGRKGPVLVDIPKDVLTETFSTGESRFPALEGYNPTITGHAGQIKKAAQFIRQAERPVFISGGGCCSADAEDGIFEFVEKADLPVVSTLMGKCGFPNGHPRYLGMMGYHGRVAANTAVSRADVIIAAGVRFGDRSTGNLASFAPGAKVIHIDIDPAEISKNVPAYLPIVGDLKHIIGSLACQIDQLNNGPWITYLEEMSRAHPLRPWNEDLSVPSILDCVNMMIVDPVIVTDVGRHQIFAAHYCTGLSRKSFITSGGLGTMGFGLPAAIGAKMGAQDRTVVLITGDGSFLMSCQEIATAVDEGIALIVLVMNDGALGMIKQLQDSFYGGRYAACSFRRRVDYAALSASMGGTGISAKTLAEVRRGIETGCSGDSITVIDCMLDTGEHAYPMVTGNTLMEYAE